jgi:hypothetical protein
MVGPINIPASRLTFKTYYCHAEECGGHFRQLAKILNEPFVEDETETRQILATYYYRNIEGNPVYRLLRYSPKDFRQQSITSTGDWIWGTKGTTPLPYRLPELLDALNTGNQVFVVEGEKDVNTLWGLGFSGVLICFLEARRDCSNNRHC